MLSTEDIASSFTSIIFIKSIYFVLAIHMQLFCQILAPHGRYKRPLAGQATCYGRHIEFIFEFSRISLGAGRSLKLAAGSVVGRERAV